MAFRPARGRRGVHLSMTPLIDVLFLLIIFFVLTGTFRRHGRLELRLPDSDTAARSSPQENEEVELAITEAGDLYLDETPISFDALDERLAALHRANAGARVLINAESRVDHAQVVRLLDAVRRAGFLGAGIGTRVAPSPRP